MFIQRSAEHHLYCILKRFASLEFVLISLKALPLHSLVLRRCLPRLENAREPVGGLLLHILMHVVLVILFVPSDATHLTDFLEAGC